MTDNVHDIAPQRQSLQSAATSRGRSRAESSHPTIVSRPPQADGIHPLTNHPAPKGTCAQHVTLGGQKGVGALSECVPLRASMTKTVGRGSHRALTRSVERGTPRFWAPQRAGGRGRRREEGWLHESQLAQRQSPTAVTRGEMQSARGRRGGRSPPCSPLRPSSGRTPFARPPAHRACTLTLALLA